MAYYDSLIAKWATLSSGLTTQQKIAQVNGEQVATGVPLPAVFTPSQILNACVAADLNGLAQLPVTQLTLLLQGGTVDASQNTTIRTGIQTIFSDSSRTLSNLAALVAPYDNPTVPWPVAPSSRGGGGLASLVTYNDLVAAGGLL